MLMNRESTERFKIFQEIKGNIGLSKATTESERMSETSQLKLQEKRETKRLALSIGETAVVSLVLKSQGKVEQQNVLRIHRLKTRRTCQWKKRRYHISIELKKCFAS